MFGCTSLGMSHVTSSNIIHCRVMTNRCTCEVYVCGVAIEIIRFIILEFFYGTDTPPYNISVIMKYAEAIITHGKLILYSNCQCPNCNKNLI